MSFKQKLLRISVTGLPYNTRMVSNSTTPENAILSRTSSTPSLFRLVYFRRFSLFYNRHPSFNSFVPVEVGGREHYIIANAIRTI